MQCASKSSLLQICLTTTTKPESWLSVKYFLGTTKQPLCYHSPHFEHWIIGSLSSGNLQIKKPGKCSIHVLPAADFCGKNVISPKLRHDNKWDHNFGWS